MKSQKLIDAIFAWWNRVSALPGIRSGAAGFEGMDQKTAKAVAWADESALRHKVIAMIDDVAPTLPHHDGVKLRTFAETILRQHDFDEVPRETNGIIAILKQAATAKQSNGGGGTTNAEPQFYPSRWYDKNGPASGATIRKAICDGEKIRKKDGRGRLKLYSLEDVERLYGPCEKTALK